MGTMRERQREVQLYRGQIRSPGRPTVAWRQDRVRFWAAIADGEKTEDAAAEAGVSSPVGFRWFRHAGGVNPCLSPTVSGRFLSFDVRAQMRAASPESGISRVTGEDRVATAVGAAAALAARSGRCALVYTQRDRLPAAAAALIRDYRPAEIIIMGGTAVITNDVRQAITDTAFADVSVRRITGSTRTDTAARAARRILASP